MSEFPETPEAWLAEALANAHHFTCTILFSRRYETARFPTLAEARAYQPAMEERAANGRKAMVYVVDTSGRTTFVPDAFAI